MNRTELTMNQMEQVNGGVMVDFGPIEGYRLYDDTTGAYLCCVSKLYGLNAARKKAASLGISDTIITREEYTERFGKRPGL